MRRRARTLAAAQMHFAFIRRQKRSEAMRVRFGVGAAFRAAFGARARDEARERFARVDRKAERVKALQYVMRVMRSDAEYQHALPRHHRQAAFGLRVGDIGEGFERGRVEASEGCLRACVPRRAKRLRVGAEAQRCIGGSASPVLNGCIDIECFEKARDADTREQIAHTMLFWRGQREKPAADQAAAKFSATLCRGSDEIVTGIPRRVVFARSCSRLCHSACCRASGAK